MASKGLIALFKDANRPLQSKEVISTVEKTPTLAADVDRATGNTALHYACCNAAPLPVVKALLKAHRPAAAMQDADGNLPLTGAIANACSPDVVKALLAAHPDGAMARRGAKQHTMLHYAVCHGQPLETVTALLHAWPEAAAIRDAEGNAPLHFAAACQASPAVVKALLAGMPSTRPSRSLSGTSTVSLACLPASLFSGALPPLCVLASCSVRSLL